MTNVRLQIGLEVIRSYRRLDYTPWYALAELIDNSTQSYKDNKAALDKALKREDSKFRVSITYDRDAKILIVRDNAMGMSLADLQRALHIGLPPVDATGRSQYGLGLKTAASWFGDRWSVRTKKLGDTHAHSIEVVVEKVAAGDGDLHYKRIKAGKEEHYTEVRIEDLHVTLHGRRLGKTKDSLRSMYRVDIREGELTLLWGNDVLGWIETIKLLPKEDGSGPERTEVDFKVGARHVWGWVGVLAPGTSSRGNAGFALVRRGRLIKGWPEAWRPETIFGAAPGRNDLINQRLVGELHLDQFDVTHTKDKINWQENEEDEVQEGIKARIPDLLARARTFRHEEAPKPETPETSKTAMAAVLRDTDFQSRAQSLGRALDSMLDKMPDEDVRSVVLETFAQALRDEKPLFEIRNGVDTFGVGIGSQLGPDSVYLVVLEIKQSRWIFALNGTHRSFPSANPEALKVHIQHVLADGMVCWAAQRGKIPTAPDAYVFAKDAILRYLTAGGAR